MKKIFSSVLPVMVVFLGLSVTAVAGSECGAGLEGNWIVKHADDTKQHLKHHLKIEKTGDARYSVKIKNEEGDTQFKSVNDFSLVCNGNKGMLSGEVKMGNCMHTLEITFPDADGMSIRIPTVHGKGDCPNHKDSLHGGDRLNHNKVASAKKRNK